MRKINVDGIKELECNERNYWGIINFFKKFTPDWYEERNIYYEGHHIYPRAETFHIEIPLIVYLPYRYHFLAHFYRAKDYSDFFIKRINYNACAIILGYKKRLSSSKLESIAEIFPKEYYELKEKLSEHNAKARKVINLETKEIYPTVTSTGKVFNLDRHTIGLILNHPEEYYKNSCYKTHYLSFYDENLEMDYYENLYQYYSSIPKRKKKPLPRESIESASIKRTGQHFVQKKSKKIKDNYTGIIYDSTTKAGEALNIDRHKVLKSCREKRPLVVKGKEYFFSFLEEANEV